MIAPGPNSAITAAFLFVTFLGVIAIAIALFRLKSRDYSLLSFGVFCTFSGFRSLLFAGAIPPLASPPFTSPEFDNFIMYCSVIGLTAFMVQIIGRGIFDSMVWAFRFHLVYAAIAVTYQLIVGRAMGQSAVPPPLVVLWCIVFIVNLIAAKKGSGVELSVTRTVLALFVLCIADDQLIMLRAVPWTLQLTQPAFLLLCVGLGFVAAHHFVFNEKKLLEIEQELEVARRIQYANLPREIHAPRGYAIAARYVPMTSVAGDFYDIQNCADSNLGILIADVSGHGVGAALIGSMLNIAFASQAESLSDPALVLTNINRILQGRMEHSFVTACALYLDRHRGRLVYANAGHPPPVLWKAETREQVRMSKGGTILGPFPDAAYVNATLEIAGGDRIILYTDGIVEARNGRGEFFGDERLDAFIGQHTADSAEATADGLIKQVYRWAGRSEQSSLDDDLTLVIVDCAGEPAHDLPSA